LRRTTMNAKVLKRSVNFSLKKENLQEIISCKKEFILSGRAQRIVRKELRGLETKSSGVFNGSPAHLRIIGLGCDVSQYAGDWLWNAMSKAIGISDAEICQRPPGYKPASLPRYAMKGL